MAALQAAQPCGRISNGTTAIAIFFLAFIAFAWLAPQDPSNPQVVTRLGLTLSIVESGRLDIDRFANLTIDKARFGDHYYADKTPGLSFLAIPVVAVATRVINAMGWEVDPDKPADFELLARMAIIGVNGFLSALATALLFLTAIRLGATRSKALFAAGTLAFATPFFGWSTAFFAHSVSGSMLMFIAATISFTFAGDRADQSSPPSILLGLGLGVLLGYTLVVDLTAAPACLLAGILTLILAARRGADTLFRTGSGLLLGAVIGLLPLLLYNKIAFGSPFTIGYSAVVGWDGMKEGFFGITWPSLRVLVELLFGPYRGLLPLSPILILVPIGLYVMWHKPRTRLAAGAIIAVLLSYLWINSSYYYWDGGSSTGPRHLVPMLPLCCLALAFAWPHTPWVPKVTLVLLAASLVLSLVCAVSSMTASMGYTNPLFQYLLPLFLTKSNLLKSLPIFLVWGAFGLLFFPPTATASARGRFGRAMDKTNHE